MLIPIILLHGLGPSEFISSFSLIPLEMFLKNQGYQNVHRITYEVNHVSIEKAVENAHKKIKEIVDMKNEIILIGQSMGGVISNRLHKKGWRVKKAIYIGSPLHGADFLNWLDIYAWPVMKFLHKEAYNHLKVKDREEEPPHSYHTISLGWFDTSFDGCVYQEEAIFDIKNNTHLPWTDHRGAFADPRLWNIVYRALN